MNVIDVSIASGLARDTQSYIGWGSGFVDFDNDGQEDFFLVNGNVYPQVDSAHTATKFYSMWQGSGITIYGTVAIGEDEAAITNSKNPNDE